MASALNGVSGEIEISTRGDGEELRLLLREDVEVLVHVLQASGIFQLGFLPGDRLLLALEEFFRGFPPGTEMIFVEDDKVPIHLMQPFILGLDVPC